ncbi:MAG: hypothetical protein HYU36_21610 [Planctomycetes bacterium]|nr:hypothetical protein [Planctomycetota bacterium]
MGVVNWSLRLGRIFGITVRLHILLLIFLGADLLNWMFRSGMPASFGLFYFVLFDTPLFLIILLHEFGHCFAARSVGGRGDEVLLWPLGGLAYVEAPNTARAQMKTAIGGPAVNVLIGLLLGAVILALRVPVTYHFEGWYSTGRNALFLHWWLDHVFKMNLALLAFNLLPAFPLDGGRILQCYWWPRMGFVEATLRAIFMGNICAVGLAITGVFSMPLLFFIALFIFFEGYQMKIMIQEGALRDESVFGYDFSQGYTSFEASGPQAPKPRKPGFFERWAIRRRQKRQEKERRKSEEIERRVDELLSKVSDQGLHSLSDQERRFLRDASKRYKR